MAVSCRQPISGSSATTVLIASCAEAPASMASSSAGPRRGSVMFWVQAAPTSARTQAQRAATAGDEELIAMPNSPVFGLNPAIESVTTPPLLGDRVMGDGVMG